MRQNDQRVSLVKKIVGCAFPIIGVLSVLMGCFQPSFAREFETLPCSIAIVTTKPVPKTRVCDATTVRTLAEQGHVFEQNQLGMVSMLAIGPGYNPIEAAKWFEQAARKGYAPAQVNLAVMYINGWGVDTNYGVALHWLHEAADRGHARAYYNLGILYLRNL
jgi:hypothetical protein